MAVVFKRVSKDGSCWYVRYRDHSGKDVRKRVPAKTKKEAELYLGRILSAVADGNYASSLRKKETKFFEIAKIFLEYSQADKRSWERDERSVAKLKQFFGDVPCEQIARSQVEKYIAERRRGLNGSGKLAKPATINRELACLKTIFRRGLLDELITHNPLAGFRLLPEDNVRDRVVSEEEFQKMLISAPTHFNPILVTAWETGMRKNEILNLCWERVDLKQGTIKLSGDGTKNGKARLIPISQWLNEVLSRIPRICDYVFTYKGARLSDIRTAFSKSTKEAGIENFRFHDLRHCFVTRMRRKGIPDRVIMKITGHETMECFKRYDTISIDDLKQAVG